MQLQKRNILVTGGAGFIGSHLVDRLARDNFVRVLDDFSTGSEENLRDLQGHPNLEVIQGDITDPLAVSTACDGMDVIFHLAVSCLRTSLKQPVRSHEVNAGGTLLVCRAARTAKVARLVYVSTSEVYGTAQSVPMSETHPLDPLTIYGAAKLAGEFYVKAYHRTYGLPAVVVRPFNTYGPREPRQGTRAEVIPRFILRLLADQPPILFGDGTQTRDFTYVDDCVEGIVLAAEADALVGDVVNIAAECESSLLHVAGLLAEILDSTVTPRLERSRPGDVMRHAADISKARKLLGFKPATDLRTGLQRTVQWFNGLVFDQPDAAELAAAANW